MTPEKESLYIGIDLGGTNTKVGLVNAQGELLAHKSFDTRVERGHEGIIDEMAEKSRHLWEQENFPKDRIVAVGVGSPGPLDPKTGVIITTPNLKWKNVPLKDMLTERLEKPVFVDNDAVSATFGEWWVGAGRAYQDTVGLTLGTGVGGGIVLEGKIHHGHLGIAGHIGHMVIEVKGRLCGCGNEGCLEAYASATAISSRAEEALKDEPDSLLHHVEKPLTGERICEAAQKGDVLAQRIFDETAFYLAIGINNVLNIINPEAVIIMGAVANAGEILFRPLLGNLQKLAFPRVHEETRILRGSLNEMAGVVGAAGLAGSRHRIEQD